MNRFLVPILLLSIAMISGCFYDSEEDLYPDATCDTVDVSYANDIKPIINNSCIVCHSAAANQGNVILEGHASLLKYVDDKSFLGSVQQISRFSPMPQGAPKISDCNIAKIESWINAGSPNN
jgi:mono/diheme cytochrome c family protein